MKKNRILSLILILLGIAADQGTKFLAVHYLKPLGTVPLIDHILHLTYAENTGAAFSMLEGGRWLFLLLTPVMLAAFGYLLFSGRIKTFPGEVAVVCIITGGLGNFIDRILNGFVVDMIYFVPINFPVFNVADIFITCGVIVFLFLYLFSKGELIEWNLKRSEKPAGKE